MAAAQISEPGLQSRVSLSEDRSTLKSIFKRITSQTKVQFIYADNLLDPKERYTIHVTNETVEKALKLLLSKKQVKWGTGSSPGIVIFSPDKAPSALPVVPVATSNMVKGIVTDNEGNVLIGATVKLEGTSRGSNTDERGHFSFFMPGDKRGVLIVTFTGYVKQDVVVSPGDSVNIRLMPSSTYLDEAVVMAYGITSKRLNTGSIGKISELDIDNQPVTNLAAALQGRIPGMEVTQSSGVAGASFSTQIHGRNSLINGSEPLFIIDGVPITPVNKKIDILSSLASQNYDNGGISPFNGLSPSSIESIEVLKDADAAAIYGSRGANGVILITTKRGKQGRLTVRGNVAQGKSHVAHMERLMNTSEYLAMRREAFANDSIEPSHTQFTDGYAPDLTIWSPDRSIDWQKHMVGGTADITDADIALSGGDTTTQFFGNSSYHRETSVFPSKESDVLYKRGTLNFTVSHKSLNKRFSYDLNGKYSSDRNLLFNTDQFKILTPPNIPEVHKPDSTLNWGPDSAYFDNPLADFLRKYRISTNNLLGSAKVSYTFRNGLTLRSSFGYNRFNTDENRQEPLSSKNPYTTTKTTSDASFASNKFESYIIEPQIEYARTYPLGKITALLGSSLQYSSTKTQSFDGEGYTDESLLDSKEAAGNLKKLIDSRVEYKYAAMFARLNYNYNDRYILNLSARRDGSSRFGPGKRSNNFGAIGAAWIFTNETFAKENLSFLSFGKIRSSYGVSGNDQIGDYRYLNTWSFIPGRFYQNGIALQPDALFNNDFSWERNTKFEGALEVSTFKDRLFGSVTYFRSKCDNQLLQIDLPATTGFLALTGNVPVVIMNKGWEFETSADIIRKKAISWKVTANLTVPFNKIVSFPGIERSSFYNPVYSVGYSSDALKVYHTQGVNPATGIFNILDVDMNGDYTSSDFQMRGKLDPLYYGGVGSSLQYGCFQMDLFVEFKNQTVPNYYYGLYLNVMPPGTMFNQAKMVEDRWQKPGDITSVQKYLAVISESAYELNGHLRSSDASFTNGRYARLKNVALSYKMDAATLKRWHLQNLSLYIQGQNLLTFTKYKGFDPETPYYFSLPPLRTVRVGIKVGI